MDQETLDFYAANAEMYLGYRPDDCYSELPTFLALLPLHARILELGCGGGVDAAYMIAHRFDVDPTDGVTAMATKAEARLGRPVRVMRFDQLDAVEAYDAVIATACLLHVPIADLSEILVRIWRALRPGGFHLASYKTGAEEGRDEHGRYYNYLSRSNADTHYRAAGDWASIAYQESHGIAHFSKPAKWLEIIARKPD
jgi:SAM-dependent methyltransferase